MTVEDAGLLTELLQRRLHCLNDLRLTLKHVQWTGTLRTADVATETEAARQSADRQAVSRPVTSTRRACVRTDYGLRS
ncbi:hypothetical protein [Streptomyces sp. RK9]|uniref:hypothetical protein n=1 Tax=Streptomyces sp. RK9 TaxID=3239284 RepID=UPI00386359AD